MKTATHLIYLSVLPLLIRILFVPYYNVADIFVPKMSFEIDFSGSNVISAVMIF